MSRNHIGFLPELFADPKAISKDDGSGACIVFTILRTLLNIQKTVVAAGFKKDIILLRVIISILNILFRNPILMTGRKWYWLWIWAFLIAYAQIYIGKHYPGDILGGVVFGGIVGGFSYRIFIWILHKSHKNPEKSLKGITPLGHEMF